MSEKLNRDLDNLTPLDARNSLLMDPAKAPMSSDVYPSDRKHSDDSFLNEPANPYRGATPMRSYTTTTQGSLAPQLGRPFTPTSQSLYRPDTREDQNLVQGAAPLGGIGGSPPRQPAMPQLPGYGGYRGVAY